MPLPYKPKLRLLRLLLLPFALMYFSALMDSVILHLRTVLLLFCCTVCTALLFSCSAIFIAAIVRNKLTVVLYQTLFNKLAINRNSTATCRRTRQVHIKSKAWNKSATFQHVEMLYSCTICRLTDLQEIKVVEIGAAVYLR